MGSLQTNARNPQIVDLNPLFFVTVAADSPTNLTPEAIVLIPGPTPGNNNSGKNPSIPSCGT